ncbi:hypothetical protein C4E88_25735 [Salmonella enterica subsp. enterica serovar Typhimurium]|nr:hypothetical protein [Salmonella enterica subsp. enterica serovar Typhimurium]
MKLFFVTLALYDNASLLISRMSFISEGENILLNENTMNDINIKINNIPNRKKRKSPSVSFLF